jgi:conjugative transfer signal peptidase TraF
MTVTAMTRRLAVFCVAGLLAATAGMGVTYNSTSSLPRGLYRIRPLSGDPARGTVVGVCLTRGGASLGRERKYVYPEGLEPWVYGTRCGAGLAVIGKPVAGVPGDTVEVSPRGVRVNGIPLRNGRVRKHDSRGRALPHERWGVRVLRAGEFWIQSEFSALSYDSRIFGPVYREQIVDQRVPLLTERARTKGPHLRSRAFDPITVRPRCCGAAGTRRED